MRFKMIAMAVSLFCLLAVPAFSADITGTWVTEITAPKDGPGGGMGGGMGAGKSGTKKMIFEFKAEGSTLTGKFIGQMGKSNDIIEGKIDGDKLSFAAMITPRGTKMKLNFTGTVSGDEFKYTFTMGGGPGGGNRPPTEYIAKRQK